MHRMHAFPFVILMAAQLGHAQPPVRIVLVGDSTVNDEGGWGPGLPASFGPQAVILNHAKNGRSSKSFRDEDLWTTALADKPAYVLVQFRHNDLPRKRPQPETIAETTYPDSTAR